VTGTSNSARGYNVKVPKKEAAAHRGGALYRAQQSSIYGAIKLVMNKPNRLGSKKETQLGTGTSKRNSSQKKRTDERGEVQLGTEQGGAPRYGKRIVPQKGLKVSITDGFRRSAQGNTLVRNVACAQRR